MSPSASIVSAAFPCLKRSNHPAELIDLAKSSRHTVSLNCGNPGAMPAYPGLDDRKKTHSSIMVGITARVPGGGKPAAREAARQPAGSAIKLGQGYQ